MSGQRPESDDASAAHCWAKRWPVGVDRVEQWDAHTVVFERRFSDTGWDVEDVAAARRAYPECEVSLSDSAALMFVRGRDSAGRTNHGQAGHAPTSQEGRVRRTLTVTRDQVQAANALIALRGSPEAVSPLIRKVAAAAPRPVP